MFAGAGFFPLPKRRLKKMTDEYDTYIEQVLTEVPDADRDAIREEFEKYHTQFRICLLYTSPSPRDKRQSRMPSSA